jgi:hypothetical protein
MFVVIRFLLHSRIDQNDPYSLIDTNQDKFDQAWPYLEKQ